MEGRDTSLQIAPNALNGGNRHICAFFNGMDEHYRVLQSFIKDGFDKGEKAFHLVDPKRREDHLRRLADRSATTIRSLYGSSTSPADLGPP